MSIVKEIKILPSMTLNEFMSEYCELFDVNNIVHINNEVEEFRAAIIGITERGEMVYDFDKMVSCLVDNGMYNSSCAMSIVTDIAKSIEAANDVRRPIIVHRWEFPLEPK